MNTLLHQPHAIPVSLGWHCHVALFLQDLGDLEKKRLERNVFDWFGIPMWSICDLVDRSFANLTTREFLKMRPRFTKKKDEILSHLTYDIRFLHEFKTGPESVSNEEWAEFEDKYKRRVERFQAMLQFSKDTGKKLLFVRMEQDLHEKIVYSEFEKPKEHDELYYVKRFADQMKERGVKFQILFFTSSFPGGYDPEHNLLSLRYTNAKPEVSVGADQMMMILKANLPLVQRCLRLV
jgi:hypothetical protein